MRSELFILTISVLYFGEGLYLQQNSFIRTGRVWLRQPKVAVVAPALPIPNADASDSDVKISGTIDNVKVQKPLGHAQGRQESFSPYSPNDLSLGGCGNGRCLFGWLGLDFGGGGPPPVVVPPPYATPMEYCEEVYDPHFDTYNEVCTPV